jgi:hydrocephalus-inducing protein
MKRIAYKEIDDTNGDDGQEEQVKGMKSLWGVWDDSMRSLKPGEESDLASILASDIANAAYDKVIAEQAADKAKGKKVKPLPPAPPKCRLIMGPMSPEGVQMVYEVIEEPEFDILPNEPQQLTVNCSAVADNATFKCEGNNENIHFRPTFMLQSTVHTFTLKNESAVTLPVKWCFDDIKRKGGTRQGMNASQSRPGTRSLPIRRASTDPLPPCPFSITPEEWEVEPNKTKEFKLTFLPLDADDYMYVLRGETCPVVLTGAVPVEDKDATSALSAAQATLGSVRMVLRATSKRPLCHFDLIESPDYLKKRPTSNMKNEFGMQSPIECTDLRIVELESTGLRTRNTFRFHIINTTNENYEFSWVAVGEPSPFWRCVQSAGMLFGGKRIEMVFEYLPDDVAVAETFFKFKLSNGVEQLFLFAGKVGEPKVFFSASKVDFHSMVLGGEGNTETVYLENQEHLPFQFSFDRTALLQLEGTNGPIIDINPKSGTILPHGNSI